MFCLPMWKNHPPADLVEKLFSTNLARLETKNVLRKENPLIVIPPQLERVSPAWLHESEERGEENLRRPQESDGHVGDRLQVQVCQAGQRLANLRGPLLPGQGKFCL